MFLNLFQIELSPFEHILECIKAIVDQTIGSSIQKDIVLRYQNHFNFSNFYEKNRQYPPIGFSEFSRRLISCLPLYPYSYDFPPISTSKPIPLGQFFRTQFYSKNSVNLKSLTTRSTNRRTRKGTANSPHRVTHSRKTTNKRVSDTLLMVKTPRNL